MASSLIGSLRVALGLDTAQFESGARKARATALGLSGDIQKSFKEARHAVEGLVAAFAVGALVDQIKQSLDFAASIGSVAATLGVTTKQLQEYRYAAGQVGVAHETLDVGLQRLVVSIGKAEVGSTAQIKAFNAIGISVDQLKGKNTGQVFELIANGLGKVTDRSQRAAVEVALFGRTGAQLDSLLAGGTKQLNALGQAAEQLGIVLSDDEIKNAEVTAHKLEALKEVLEAQIAGVVVQNANAILSLSSAIATLTGQVLRFLSSNPQLALGIIGGLAGSRFGVVGAALGAAGGAVAGDKLAQVQRDSNTDLTFRTQQMRSAQQEYISRLHEQNSGSIFTVRHGNASSGPTLQSARDEFYRQLGLLKSATAQAGTRPAVRPGPDLPKFLAGGGKGRSTRTPRQPRDKNEDDLFQAHQQQLQIDLQILEAKKSLSHDYVEQTTLSIQALDVQKQITDNEINHKVEQAKRDFAEHKITAETLKQIEADAQITRGKEDELDQLRRQAVIDAEQEQRFRDVAHLTDVDFDLQKDKLQDEEGLARTTKERRDIELRLLDLAYQQEKARLESVLADKQSTDAEKEEARRRLVALNQQYGTKRDLVLQQTRSPLDEFRASLPQSMAEVREAIEKDGVAALQDFNDQLADAIVNGKSVGDVLHSVFTTLLTDLIKLGEQELESALLGKPSGSPGGGGGGLLGALSSLLGGGGGGVTSLDIGSFANNTAPLIDVPAFDTGGSFSVLGNTGVDKNTLSLNGLPIANVSHGEKINVANDSGGDGSPLAVHMPITIDATGADPAALDRLRAELQQLQHELPSRVVGAIQDAKARFVRV